MKKHRLPHPAIVYIVINTRNGKRYIGVTSKSVRTRMREHFCHARKNVNNGHFYRAIRKYGRDVFEAFIIRYCESGYAANMAEIELISVLKPEYNSTRGGDGQLGRVMSAETKKRISEFHKGNKYHLGRKHTQEMRQLLREVNLQPEAIERWKKFASMGPRAMARPVQCIDDGKIYESASAAARSYDVPKSAVIEICLGKKHRKSIGGHRFVYAEKKS